MANTYLTRTPSTAGNRKTWTWSAWIKRSALGSSVNYLFSAGTDANGADRRYGFYLYNDLLYQDRYGGSNALTQVFRDVSAWYHIVISVDTTQATASNRTKVYINNTLYNLTTLFNQNEDTPVNSTLIHSVGGGTDNLAANHFNGSMSHINFIDGTAYDATAFGQYDANGVWKIKTSPSVTYGTNGFFILKNGNSVTDQSPNTNNFTVGGGTLTNTEDSPSNVFATLNPLIASSIPTYSNGNLTIAGASTWESSPSTLAVSSGLWYAEFKDVSGSNNMVGVENAEIQTWITQFPGYSSDGWGYARDGGKRNSGSDTAYGSSFTSGDIISIALDMDNKFVYFAKNGTWQNSGDPTSGATGTGGLSLSANEYYFVTASYNSSSSANFGNGYFGATAISSAGTNASGIGIFEHDLPTGYTALSTKGLNL